MPQLVLIRLRYLFNRAAMLFLITAVFGGACAASENMSLPGFGPPDFDHVNFEVAAANLTFIKIIAR